MANFLTQYGITWTFDKNLVMTSPNYATDYLYGQYLTGDYWVYDSDGSVVVTVIDPATATGAYDTGGATRTINGSDLDPICTVQGYDTSSHGYISSYAQYNISHNIGDDLPLTIIADHANPYRSLVSTVYLVSTDAKYNKTSLSSAAILTVVHDIPAANSFRPSYYNGERIQKVAGDIVWENVPSLVPVDGTPTIASYATHMTRPWIDHVNGPFGDWYHPKNNMDDYAREMAHDTSQVALRLCLNDAQAQKQTLMYVYLQLAIDYTGMMKNGMVDFTRGGAGMSAGRKLPVMFGAMVFGDADMIAVGTKSGDYLYSGGHHAGDAPENYIQLGEDSQTFYVSQLEVDLMTLLSGNTWTYRCSVGISGTIAVGNTVIQATTGATGVIGAIDRESKDWVEMVQGLILIL
jgi:hypothetical protein